MEHFVSETCKGEICGPCFRERGIRLPATHKLGEEIPSDVPNTGHNLTQYVCCYHFAQTIRPKAAFNYRGCKV